MAKDMYMLTCINEEKRIVGQVLFFHRKEDAEKERRKDVRRTKEMLEAENYSEENLTLDFDGDVPTLYYGTEQYSYTWEIVKVTIPD